MADLEQIAELIEMAIERVIYKRPVVKEWLSTKEACDYANCSPSKLTQLIKAGEIKAANVGVRGQTVSVLKKSIDEYFTRNIYQPNKHDQANFFSSVYSGRVRRGKTPKNPFRIPQNNQNGQTEGPVLTGKGGNP